MSHSNEAKTESQYGNYDFTVHFTQETPFPGPMAGANPPLASDASAPSLFTALEEQLGLRLESTKAPVDILVIEHIEEPAPN